MELSTVEIRKDDQVELQRFNRTHLFARALAAAVNHTRQVERKHPSWTPAERIGCFTTSLRRAFSEIKMIFGEDKWKFWEYMESRFLDITSWEAPGSLKNLAHFHNTSLATIELDLAFQMMRTMIEGDEFAKAADQLDQVEKETSTLTQCVEYLTLANIEASKVAAQFETLLEAYPELTNGSGT